MNSTTCSTFSIGETVCLPPIQIPFYFVVRKNLLDGIPDTYVAFAAPVLAYWIVSLTFYCLDISDLTNIAFTSQRRSSRGIWRHQGR
ncbi:hypothetical protein K503DRAFT_773471 [Rhizopogon vinicolor AM-OR11-026]|uniref:Uncharacterized protein n=1 Tax=Rhizopogon vinicolor AM-OR11-026 TaxID=1314800 RepID=A0A1B7MS54_9AGAM|nr:hypothetical protein K503DRAFT_773471 [Rhizopogon vinicolor AM-OR11-026]